MLEPIQNSVLGEAIRSKRSCPSCVLEMHSKEKSQFSLQPYTKPVLALLKFANWVQNSFYMVQFVNINKFNCTWLAPILILRIVPLCTHFWTYETIGGQDSILHLSWY
jgi:hypothetical protein